jgi:tRNA G18 (ribose-2'-O)-methylase SpoU
VAAREDLIVVIPVADPADHRLDDYRNVPDPELLEHRGLFVAEGRLVVARLLSQRRFAARSVLVTEAAHAMLGPALAGRPELPVFLVSQEVIRDITGFNIHRGCLAIGERPTSTSWREVAATAGRLVVLERVANADNVGGVFRNAAAFGADAVLLGPGCADPLYRKTIRTSMGAALTVPFAHAASWPDDLVTLRADGIVTIALTPQARDVIGAVVEALPEHARVALLLGHEGDGLSPDALAACTFRAAIPMAPGVDSLNVASAAAIALYALSGKRPSRA